MQVCATLIFSLAILSGGLGQAASKKKAVINWYEPQIFEAKVETAVIRLSGETSPRTTVSVDMGRVISISGGSGKRPNKSEIRSTKSDEKGFFELEISVSYGILQIPIQVQTGKDQEQNLLVIFEVANNAVKINAKTVPKPKETPFERPRPKPESNGTSFDFSIGVAYPAHKYSQKISQESDVSFQSGNAPSINFEGGGSFGSIGFDIGYSSSSGKIATAAAPFIIKKGDYKWQNLFLTGSYLFGDRPKKKGSGYEVRFGYGSRIQPFLSIDSVTKEVTAVSITAEDAIVGFNSKFGQVTDSFFEVGINYHMPISSSSDKGEYTLKSASTIEVNFAIKKALSDSYFLVGFLKIMSNNSSFDYKDSTVSANVSGSNSFLVTDVGGSLGFSF